MLSFSGYIYHSLGIFLSNPVFSVSLSTACELFWGEPLDTVVVLSAILLPIKSSVDSAVFWIALFEAVLSAFVADYLVLSISFWLYLLKLFFPNVFPIFLAKVKNL